MSNPSNLQIGEVVYLKSGSPRLVITAKISEVRCEIQWVTSFNQELRQTTLPWVCLTRDKPVFL